LTYRYWKVDVTVSQALSRMRRFSISWISELNVFCPFDSVDRL